MKPIDVNPKDLEVVRTILREQVPEFEVRAFGSRVAWSAREMSDLDLALMTDAPLPIARMAELKEAFVESDLPFKVDVVDWTTTKERFRRIIEKGCVVVQVEAGGRSREVGAEWISVQLGDVTDLLTGFPFKSDGYVEDTNAPRLLRGDNVVQGALRWDGVKRWPLEPTDDLAAYWLREGDVVLAMDRPWIAAGLKYACVRESDLPVLLVQRVARLRGDDHLDTRFLKYVIGSQAFTYHVLAVQTGTAVPHISGGQIREFKFLLPPLPEQRAIAHILGTLDDKIELNRRMSETLEAMARALFKSWFVDFDPVRAKMEGRWRPGQSLPGLPANLYDLFPDKLVPSELGEIPEGWEVEPLDAVASFQNGLALQKYRPEGEQGRLPVVKIAQLRSGKPDSREWAATTIKPECVIDDGDVVFSWSGSLMVKVWCGGRGALNQHLFKVTSTRFSKWFYLHCTLLHLREFQLIASGKATTMGHIKRQHLQDAKCVVPSPDLLAQVDEIFGSTIDRMVANEIESRTLAALRDTLLPKLISGELRVKDAGQILGSAV